MRFRFIPAAFLALLCSQAPAQVVAPANPVVQVGQTLQFTADRPVQWSLLPGSAGTMDPGGTYHAPASINAPASMGGCQIGAPDSVFNTRVDNLPLHANNTTWMAALPSQGIGLTSAWGTNIADNTTPSQVMNFAYTPGYNGQTWQIPAWPSLKRQSGVFSDPQTNVDRHVLTVNRQTCHVYELYNNYPAGLQPTLPLANAQSGWQYDSMSYGLPTAGATDAAGMPLAATTLTLDDIRSGAIRHAMRVTFANGYIAHSFVWPATSNAGAWGTVPYGTRFRLKADVDISTFSPIAQVILTGLKQYGMIISDGGGNWDIAISTDLSEDRAVQAAILEIQNKKNLVNATQFEIVDESSLMVSPSSSQVAYNNGYVTPPAFAIAKADDGVDPPVTFPIALQGVALNSPDGDGVWIQSGVATTLAVFAGGTSNPSVTWTMNPAVGTLDPATGAYTAPSVNAPTTTSLTATSVADPNVSVTFPLTVMPAGSIRIDVGDATANPAAPHASAPDYGPDSQGNMWWRDQAAERGWGVKNDYWYGPNYGHPAPWPSTTDIYLYETQWYNQADTTYKFLVPNGNYNIDYYVAQGSCYPTNQTDPLLYREHLESQGQIAAHDFRPLAITGGNCYTPVHTTIPAQVTDNNIYFALRRLTDHTQTGQDQFPVTIASAFSISPATETAHITIDPATPPALTMSQSIQLYAVGWFIGNQVTWTLQSGPGTVNANGLYTAPAKPMTGTAVILATSTADPSQTATIAISLVFGSMILSPGSATVNRSATQQIAASIGGQPYSNVTWSISSGIGWINTAGVYTAPGLLAQDTAVTITATSIDNPSQTASATVTIRANPQPIRVNCSGAGGFTDAQGNVWATDYGYSGPTHAYNVSVPIARTTPDMYPLYDSSRYVYSNQTFEYNFPLPNGTYLVTLKFADYTFSTPGFYHFNVQIDGVQVLTNFDPDAVYGTTKTAVDETFVALVESKNLNITFVGLQGGAMINGIQILPTAANSRTISGAASVTGTTR